MHGGEPPQNGFPRRERRNAAHPYYTTTSSKEARRQTIAQKHRIVLLIGDNLNDLAQVFERKPVAERKAAVDAVQAEFGARFIVLPNAMYGDWESALYGYQNGLSEADKRLLRTNALQGY